MSDRVQNLLAHWTHHVQCIKFSSMQPDGRLRSSTTTRINGTSLTLIPYDKKLVPPCFKVMQHEDVYMHFGINPPTFEEVSVAHELPTDPNTGVACTTGHVG